MALHDWSDQENWSQVHTYWLVHLANSIRPQLPPGYRVYIGMYTNLGEIKAYPDIDVVTPWPTKMDQPEPSQEFAPDYETTVTATLDPRRAICIQKQGHMVAALEVVSPANKDAPSVREETARRYAGYLLGGVNLAVVDLLPRPHGFSFHEAIAGQIGLKVETPLNPPMAVSFRPGHSLREGGSRLAVWQRPMKVGEPLPSLPLPLSLHAAILVDLESTYSVAASNAYLDD